ncbi:hypothetical protein LMH73_009140 [Vibrio splendidus]|nr:hypothetical protein [Vibrio splendidus]MCC4880311.1 hypothetical protein [Vibrio splendidus]
MNTQLSKLKFPELPKFSGHWYPLYITPVIGSEEKIALAVAVIGADGTYLIKEALSDDGYMRFFGGHELKHILKVSTGALSLYLETKRNIDDWKAPLSGIELGRSHEALGDDLLDIATQGLRFSSLFYGLEQRAISAK